MNPKPNLTKEQDAKIVELTRQLTDAGKLIEAGWVIFLSLSALENAPQIQREEMRKAFFLGAQHLFSSIFTCFEEGEEATEPDVRRIEAIHDELEKFKVQYLLSPEHPGQERNN